MGLILSRVKDNYPISFVHKYKINQYSEPLSEKLYFDESKPDFKTTDDIRAF